MNIWNKKNIISPSLITLDMMNLAKNISDLEKNGIEMLHVDLLDGHFSPSLPIGLETIKQLRNITNLPFECHIMSDIPEFFVDELLKIGVQQIVFHIENANHVDGLINYIKNNNVRAGVALKPSTSLKELDYIIEKCDTVLLMQINPGYASAQGESLISYLDRKIYDLRELIISRGLSTKISIDGRVSLEIIKKYKDIVDIFIVGTTALDPNNLTESIEKIKEIIS